MQSSWQEYGEVFTRTWVAEIILDLVGYDPEINLCNKVILEPAVGSGAFLVPIVQRLLASAKKHNQPVSSLTAAIRGYDLQAENVAYARARLHPILRTAGVTAVEADNLLSNWVSVQDFLLTSDLPKADYVVGNPPYIRLEAIPPKVSEAYRRRFATMRGRADIYVGFYEHALSHLKPEGRLGFICADRWMRNQYGAALRSLIGDKYAVEVIWTMHEVDAFEAEVSAYPAITILRNGLQRELVVSDTDATFDYEGARALTAWSRYGSSPRNSGLGYDAHRLESWFTGPAFWPSGAPSQIALIEHLNEHFPPLQDVDTGTRVSIGVATGADKVYVVRKAEVEPDRLLPLAMAADLQQNGEFTWGGHHLINPWSADGSLVDLGEYPRLRRYLESAPGVRARHVAKKYPKDWYRTIDKVNSSIIAKPKLLLQDMRATINPVLETGGFYPHHNLYYITSESWDLEVLGALLLSRIGQAFIQAYAVRMRGGTLRFQAQYLRMIRVPRPEYMPAPVAQRLREAFRNRDVNEATDAAEAAYEINLASFDIGREEASIAR